MDVDQKQYNQFQIEVLNRLEQLHEDVARVDIKIERVRTTLFGQNGDPGRLATIDRRLEAHTRSIARIFNLLWPMVGAIALLAWIGLSGVKQMLQ